MNASLGSYVLILLVSMFFFAGCTNQDGLAGNSSQTPNALVGKLYEPDSVTPARDVRVHIRSRGFCTVIPDIGSADQLTDTIYVVTDDGGWFAFDTTLDTGMYVIEATSGNNAVFIDSIAIVNNGGTDTLAPRTLKPAGVLKGMVLLSEGGSPRKVFVRIAGIDRFTAVEDDGRFRFSGLAEGHYDVNILPTLDNYDIFDTVNISIWPADTTDLGLVNLPFTGIPTIKNVTVVYDTLSQWVTLRWSRPITGRAYYFNIYRRAINPTTAIFTQLNMFPITDTLFTDSLGEQDRTYEYRITAVDSATTEEGTRSEGVTARIALYDITPANVIITYDTLRQTIALHWNNPAAELVTGYNVYRRNVDLGEVFWTPFNKNAVQDTIFVDSAFNVSPNYSLIEADSIESKEPTYEYCVGALIKNIREGARSKGIPVRISLKYLKPANVKATFNPVDSAVCLSWNRPDTAIVKSFTVFRKDSTAYWSAATQINREPVRDTFFIDTMVTHGRTYEYRIASVVIDSRALVKSAAVLMHTDTCLRAAASSEAE